MQTPDPAGVPLELSLPKASFVSESEFRRERDVILFADWFCVGRAESLAAAGEFLTADVAGESVIVVRGEDGGLRGFYNLCRHRGSRLVPPEDSAPDGLETAGAAAARSGAIRRIRRAFLADRVLRGVGQVPVSRLDVRA